MLLSVKFIVVEYIIRSFLCLCSILFGWVHIGMRDAIVNQ